MMPLARRRKFGLFGIDPSTLIEEQWKNLMTILSILIAPYIRDREEFKAEQGLYLGPFSGNQI